MKNKMYALLFAVLMLFLTGCQLAQVPSEQQNQNNELAQARFMGVYVVREDPFAELDRTHWVEYGAVAAETEFGQIYIPTEILIGEYDQDSHEFTFPGLEGYALFAMNVITESGSYNTMVNDMVGGNFHLKTTDAGDSYELSGTLYYGPPADDPDYDQWEDDLVWHHYRVYQMEDGTVFLSGYGDSHKGAMGSTVTVTNTATVNGEEMEYYTKTDVKVEYIERLSALTVLQYDGDGNLLKRTALPIEGSLPEVAWLPSAEWAVVEEQRGEEVTRTAYDRPDKGESDVSHTVILLDSNGMGSGSSIKFE